MTRDVIRSVDVEVSDTFSGVGTGSGFRVKLCCECAGCAFSSALFGRRAGCQGLSYPLYSVPLNNLQQRPPPPPSPRSVWSRWDVRSPEGGPRPPNQLDVVTPQCKVLATLASIMLVPGQVPCTNPGEVVLPRTKGLKLCYLPQTLTSPLSSLPIHPSTLVWPCLLALSTIAVFSLVSRLVHPFWTRHGILL